MEGRGMEWVWKAGVWKGGVWKGGRLRRGMEGGVDETAATVAVRLWQYYALVLVYLRSI